MMTIPERTLNDGHSLPSVAFGTYKLNGTSGVEAIVSALDVGYRLLDSAFNYENEGAVGEAIRRSSVPRDQIIVTSKLPGRRQQYDQAMATIEESLWRSGVEYYDIYLIHWPNPKQGLYVEAWSALIDAQKRGLLRTIGVCNFLPDHLDRLKAETGVMPAINQIELHPYFPQPDQLAYDAAQGIVTQSWSPLGRGTEMINLPIVQTIARRLGKTGAQVLLRWHVQLGAVPLPKSSTRSRQIENLSLFDFELSADDMAAIATLARPDGRLKGQDPAVYEEF